MLIREEEQRKIRKNTLTNSLRKRQDKSLFS